VDTILVDSFCSPLDSSSKQQTKSITAILGFLYHAALTLILLYQLQSWLAYEKQVEFHLCHLFILGQNTFRTNEVYNVCSGILFRLQTQHSFTKPQVLQLIK
jgi:hypothetical protein